MSCKKWIFDYYNVSIYMLCILKLFLRMKLSTKNITRVLWIVCVKLFAQRGEKCGETYLSFTTTIIHRFTLNRFFMPFSPLIRPILFQNLSSLFIWPRSTSGYSANSKIRSGTPFWVNKRKSKKNWKPSWKLTLTAALEMRKFVRIT